MIDHTGTSAVRASSAARHEEPVNQQDIANCCMILRSWEFNWLASIQRGSRRRWWSAEGLWLWNSLPADLRQDDISFQRFQQL